MQDKSALRRLLCPLRHPRKALIEAARIAHRPNVTGQ